VIGRPFLHAGGLEFTHPFTGDDLRFVADLPADLAEILDRLRT
jgi:23S rRNA-/tRNA-specific pseudouridylate synthase